MQRVEESPTDERNQRNYDVLRRSVLGTSVREDGWFDEELNVAATPEIELQSLWFGGAFGDEFQDVDGRSVKIVQFGHWNHSAGPDFLHACVEVDGVRSMGAIELDTDARDWEHHGHGNNADYNDVVLHLFFNAPMDRFFTKTADHREVVQVRLDAEGLVKPRPVADAHPGRCLLPLREMSESNLKALLRGAALSRATRKAKRFEACARIHGEGEAWFQALAEVLGYRHNKIPLRALAQALSLKSLRQQDGLTREAMMMGLAGFLDAPEELSANISSESYLRELWSRWWRSRPDAGKESMRGLQWRLSGVRPMNHPQRRIGALAAVVNDWPKFERLVTGSMDKITRRTKKFSQGLEHSFWSTHYTLKSAEMEKPMALIGDERWRDLLANVVLPVAIHRDGGATARSSYFELKSAQVSEPVRTACQRLFGSLDEASPLLKSHAYVQGILAVFDDFCLRDFSGCGDCMFPEQLAQWRVSGA